MYNICVIFGGVSCEHDISIITAMQVINNLDRKKYNIYPVYIDKNGSWYYSKNFDSIDNILSYKNISKQCTVILGSNVLYQVSYFNRLKKVAIMDHVLVAMHGTNGEDGSISALCNLCNSSSISPDIFASAVGIDKCVFKNYVNGLNVCNTINFVEYVRGDSIEKLKRDILSCGLIYPLILKPATLGSSIGISIAHDEEELLNKVAFSLRFDSKILIETKLKNIKEYNIAILRSRDKLIISEIEEPVNSHEILNFQDKYISGNKSSTGMASAKRIVPAEIDGQLKSEIESVACIVYKKLNLSSVVRFDFILDCDNSKLYLNEINTVPGSFAYYLFPNLKFSELLDLIIDTAIYHNQFLENRIKYFHSTVLTSASSGIKK